jgi:hypothetical protein
MLYPDMDGVRVVMAKPAIFHRNKRSDTAPQDAAWGEPARGEPRWPAALAVVLAIVLYVTLPDKLTFGSSASKVILPGLEAALLIPLLVTAPNRDDDETRWQRMFALAVIAVINLANLVSLVLLVHELLGGKKTGGHELIFFSMQIWFTNVIVFALWYWELDRGGPGKRCSITHREPDFLFPQMVTPAAAADDWYPSFIDYTYVSFTNATAFSPTDTMPLTEWAKILMMIQSLASLITVALVAARAVNILG